MRHLVDGDLASNQHGWQWTAGTGTDAAPVLPRVQPGDRRAASSTRTATTCAAGCRNCAASTARRCTSRGTLAEPPGDYPERIVDHAAERQVALERYQEARGRIPARPDARPVVQERVRFRETEVIVFGAGEPTLTLGVALRIGWVTSEQILKYRASTCSKPARSPTRGAR